MILERFSQAFRIDTTSPLNTPLDEFRKLLKNEEDAIAID